MESLEDIQFEGVYGSPRRQTMHPVLPTHAFSVTVFTLRASSLKQWLQELCSFERAVYQWHITVQFSVRQLQAGVKGSPFRRQQLWKKRNQLEKLLGSGRHKFSCFFFLFRNTLQRKIEVIWVLQWRSFFLFTAFSISCFNYRFPLHCNLKLLVGNDPYTVVSFH